MTYDDLVQLFDFRTQEWGESSVAIANMFPSVWLALETYAKRRGIENIQLRDIRLMPQLLEYTVVSNNAQIKATFPVDVVLSEDVTTDDLVTYLETDAPAHTIVFTGTPAEISRKQQLLMLLQHEHDNHPQMFIDYERLLTIDQMLLTHQVFKGELTNNMH